MTMLDVRDGMYTSSIPWNGMIRQNTAALLAATFPIKPPRRWFDNPALATATPLTIQSDGHVFGHIATWKQSHIGMIGKVNAPRSRSGYGFYATGAVECDDGSLINVGQITLTGGHAPLEASVAEAVAHYDDTRSAWCDVAVGEDDIGIWAAGALRPDINDIQLRSIRASSVSGDWRPINGNLELVAVCGVNVPGFPITRARVASGQVVALVAAGTEELVSISMSDQLGVDVQSLVATATDNIDRRLALVEDALLDRVRERREGLTAALQNSSVTAEELRNRVRPQDPSLVASLRDRVRPPVDPALVASLRDRVHTDLAWDDGMAIDLPVAECIQASLRARVQGLTATATSAWKADKRKEAAGKGQALPDGSYPIKDKTDWRKARQALGRASNRAKVVRHLKKRGRALGIPKEELDRLAASAAPFSPSPVDTQLADTLRQRVHSTA
jgi:hypothetical protein